MHSKLIFFVFIFLFQLFSFEYLWADASFSSESISELRYGWKFIAKDSPEFTKMQIDDTNWSNINPYPTWTDQGFYHYQGIGWFRFHFTLVNASQSYSLYIPLQYRGGQLYINEKLLYQSGPLLPDGNFPPIIGNFSLITIPEGLLNQGENIISFRTQWLDDNAGLIDGIILFGPRGIMENHFFRSILYYSALICLPVFAGMIFLIIFIRRRNDLFYLFFCLASWTLSIWIFGFKGYANKIIDTQAMYVFTTYGGAVASPIMLVHFTAYFLQLKNKYILITISSVFVFLMLFITGNYLLAENIYLFQHLFYRLFILLSGLANIYAIYLAAKGIFLKRPYSKYIFIGLVLFLVSLGVSSAEFLDIANTSYFVNEGFFLMTLCFTAALAIQFAEVHNNLVKANADLLVLDKMKDDFLANTSHEFRTPLHGIISLTESVLYEPDGKLSADQRENINIVLKSARHLSSLVNEILEFSKLKAKKLDLFYEEIKLNELVQSTISLLRQTANEKGISIECTIDNLLFIQADRRQIFQVLLNLIGNAIKFTNEGDITINATVENGCVTLCVKDTGTGISPENLNSIWIPFKSLSSNGKNGGTGLGLPITKEIISMHGGTIWAESAIGSGSSFYISLPIKSDGAALHSFRDSSLKNKANKNTENQNIIIKDQDTATGTDPIAIKKHDRSPIVLVVDDDDVNVTIIQNICRRYDYTIITASTPQETFDQLELSIPDLILLDVMLPGMSGYEICHKIRENKNYPFIPIIMLTARGFLNDKLEGFTHGANDYMVKPFERNELLARMENMLAIKKIIDIEASFFSDIETQKTAQSLYLRSATLQEATDKLLQSQRIITHNLKLSKIFINRLMTVSTNSPCVDIAIDYKPLLTIGGDIYHIDEYLPGRIRIFLADATGHGIHASLNSISILTEYSFLHEETKSPAEILQSLNKQYCKQLRAYKMNFNCAIAEINIDQKTITYSSAGHPEQILSDSSGTIHPLHIKGPIIGLWPDAEYTDLILEFNPGSFLVMFTDGLIPGYSSSKGGLKLSDASQKIMDLVRGNHSLLDAAKNTADHLHDEKDDCTLIIAKYL